MKYVGKWIFHSVGIPNDENEMVFLGADEYLNSPMPYIDTDDSEAVADEIKERKQIIGGIMEICDDGKLYMLMPLPQGVTKKEIDEAVAEGYIKLRDGMMTDEPKPWEERDGELWLEVGTGMSDDGWVKLSENEEYLTFMTVRYIKAE